jgi:hypothetical protein
LYFVQIRIVKPKTQNPKTPKPQKPSSNYNVFFRVNILKNVKWSKPEKLLPK